MSASCESVLKYSFNAHAMIFVDKFPSLKLKTFNDISESMDVALHSASRDLFELQVNCDNPTYIEPFHKFHFYYLFFSE